MCMTLFEIHITNKYHHTYKNKKKQNNHHQVHLLLSPTKQFVISFSTFNC